MHRRHFIISSTLCFPALLSAVDVLSLYKQKSKESGSIWIRRDGKEIKETLIKDGVFDRNVYTALCYLLKDKRADEAVTMDPKLFIIISTAQEILAKTYNIRVPFLASSGYRNTKTNASIEGAAKNSFHIKGRAIDGIFMGLTPLDSAKIARAAGGDGIGVYSTFTHIDTGALRAWWGR